MKKHGHVWCVLRFFEKHNSGLDNAASLFSWHPMTSARIERVRDAIKSNKYPEENCIPVKL
jgi:Zn-dependent protease with chaperone function